MRTVANRGALHQGVTPFSVRPMGPGDVAQVSDIERECFPTMKPSTSFHRELSNRLARYLVAVDSGKSRFRRDKRAGPSSDGSPAWSNPLLAPRLLLPFLRLLGHQPAPAQQSTDYLVGYVGLWFMVDEAHIVAIGVREGNRRQGLGELLLLSSVELARKRLARVVSLEVRVSNESAQRMYEKYGFVRVGLRKGYYADNREDAVIMTTDDITSPSYLARFQRLVDDHAHRWGWGRRDPD